MRTNPSKYKLSFCIVCMNRLYQLKETLLKNIADNSLYTDLEFIVLDYNSQDGMEEWVFDKLQEHLVSGRVKYFRTDEPTVFSHSHSKNMAFLLAEGDIVCNISADHYTGKDFAFYVNNCYQSEPNIVLTTIDYHQTKANYKPKKDVWGKVCVKKADFMRVGGFDEKMKNYGFEDFDFVNRVELSGVKRVLIEDHAFLKFISHQDAERFSFERGLYRVYINYLKPHLSEILFLYEDNTFQQGMLFDNTTYRSDDYRHPVYVKDYRYSYSLLGPSFTRGTWSRLANTTAFTFDAGENSYEMTVNDCSENMLKNQKTGWTYYWIRDPQICKDLMQFNFFIDNRNLMENNLKSNLIQVNLAGFGRGTVYKKI